MTAITATTTPQQVSVTWDTIQNLGSVDCWIAQTQVDCTTTTGLKLVAAGTFSRTDQSAWRNLWIRSDTSTADVRVFGA